MTLPLSLRRAQHLSPRCAHTGMRPGLCLPIEPGRVPVTLVARRAGLPWSLSGPAWGSKAILCRPITETSDTSKPARAPPAAPNVHGADPQALLRCGEAARQLRGWPGRETQRVS